jgi:asparagine synthetase B (glutamine-hydrolysing)
VWHAESLSSFRYDFKQNKIDIEKRIRKNADRYFKLAHKALDSGDLYNIMGYANIFTVIGSGNHSADIATMRYSIENRSPFLDYRLYEFLMSVPDKLKSKYGEKGLLRKILKKHLPTYITEAIKSGPTMPINRWLYDNKINHDIEKFLFTYLSTIEEYLSIDIVNKIQSKGWVNNNKNALQLFAIISFVIWAKFNILNDIPDENITFEELIKT